LTGRRLFVSYHCHFLEKYVLCCGRKMVGKQQQGVGVPTEGKKQGKRTKKETFGGILE